MKTTIFCLVFFASAAVAAAEDAPVFTEQDLDR